MIYTWYGNLNNDNIIINYFIILHQDLCVWVISCTLWVGQIFIYAFTMSRFVSTWSALNYCFSNPWSAHKWLSILCINANRRRAYIPLQLYYYNRIINPTRKISIGGKCNTLMSNNAFHFKLRLNHLLL